MTTQSSEPRPRRFLSVGSKLAGATLALMVVVAIGVSIGFSRYQRESLLGAKEMAGIAVTRLFADSCVAPVVFDDDTALNEALAALGRNREVEYAAVFRSDDSKRVGRRMAELLRGPREVVRSVPAAIQIERQAKRVVVTSPVIDQTRQTVAVATVALSLANENRAIEEMTWRALGLSSALALGLSVLLVIMARLVIVRPLGRLVLAANKLEEGTHVEIDVRAHDEVGHLARAFHSMAQAITVREERIRARNRDMRLVLDNVEQGFITLDASGAISEERSRSVDGWFGDASGSPKFWDYLRRVERSVGAWFELGWESIQEGVLPLDLCLEQLPKRVSQGKARFELAYRPILRDERLDKLIVVITEVTARIAREQAEQAQREQMSIFRRILSDRFAFEQFYTEATALVAAIVAFQEGGDLDELKRDVHTLKGNCALYEIESIVSFCHDLESWMSETGQGIDDARKETLYALWASVSEQRAQLTRDGSTRIELDREEYETFLANLERGADRNTLVQTFASWEFEPAAKRLEFVAEQIRRVAARLQKAPVDVVCQPTTLRLPPSKWNAFWSVFAHVVRNTVDHGIETADERAASGKPAHALVALAVAREGDQIIVHIQDDGRGIDWTKIAARAKSRGLPHTSRRDLEQALFADGVSSREEASNTSGRGVGLSAVRETLNELGASVEVSSEPGRGTTFRFVLPLGMLVDGRYYGSAAA